MPYRPDLEAEELAWRNAERNGARASRPLVMDPAEARRQRLAEQDPFGLDDDDPPTSPWIDEGLWDTVTVRIVFDDTALREELARATITVEQLLQSLGWPAAATSEAADEHVDSGPPPMPPPPMPSP